MNQHMRTTGRNQPIECCRLAASILVVFIHCHFPGNLGSVCNCLARIAVPFFFIVSGYFAWGIGPEKICRRAREIAKLTIVAFAAALTGDMVIEVFLEGAPLFPWILDKISIKALTAWFVVNASLVAGGHFWYLSSILACYAVMYVYVRWHRDGLDYGPLYLLGSVLLALQFVLGSFAMASGMEIPFFMYRNAVLLGLPLFSLGLFIREHHTRIRDTFALNNRKLLALLALGAVMSLLQWFSFGVVELPVGTLLEVVALMLLLAAAPPLAKENSLPARMIAHFGSLSTFVYVTHLIWVDFYWMYAVDKVTEKLGALETFLYPIFIVLTSLILGTVWEVVKSLASSLKSRMPVK